MSIVNPLDLETLTAQDRDSLMRRFAAKLTGQGDCLVFTGHRTEDGYGRIKVQSKMIGAHRLAWQLIVGPIPEGVDVCHRCDNPPCCYVDHLFLGTHADNNADRAAKGRSRGTFQSGPDHPATKRSGQRHWQVKVSDDDVRSIRERRAAGQGHAQIAAAFNIHPATVSRIARRIWRQEVA